MKLGELTSALRRPVRNHPKKEPRRRKLAVEILEDRRAPGALLLPLSLAVPISAVAAAANQSEPSDRTDAAFQRSVSLPKSNRTPSSVSQLPSTADVPNDQAKSIRTEHTISTVRQPARDAIWADDTSFDQLHYWLASLLVDLKVDPFRPLQSSLENERRDDPKLDSPGLDFATSSRPTGGGGGGGGGSGASGGGDSGPQGRGLGPVAAGSNSGVPPALGDLAAASATSLLKDSDTSSVSSIANTSITPNQIPLNANVQEGVVPEEPTPITIAGQIDSLRVEIDDATDLLDMRVGPNDADVEHVANDLYDHVGESNHATLSLHGLGGEIDAPDDTIVMHHDSPHQENNSTEPRTSTQSDELDFTDQIFVRNEQYSKDGTSLTSTSDSSSMSSDVISGNGDSTSDRAMGQGGDIVQNVVDAPMLVVDSTTRKLYGIDQVQALRDGHSENAILFSIELRDENGEVINARPLGVTAARPNTFYVSYDDGRVYRYQDLGQFNVVVRASTVVPTPAIRLELGAPTLVYVNGMDNKLYHLDATTLEPLGSTEFERPDGLPDIEFSLKAIAASSFHSPLRLESATGQRNHPYLVNLDEATFVPWIVLANEDIIVSNRSRTANTTYAEAVYTGRPGTPDAVDSIVARAPDSEIPSDSEPVAGGVNEVIHYIRSGRTIYKDVEMNSNNGRFTISGTSSARREWFTSQRFTIRDTFDPDSGSLSRREQFSFAFQSHSASTPGAIVEVLRGKQMEVGGQTVGEGYNQYTTFNTDILRTDNCQPEPAGFVDACEARIEFLSAEDSESDGMWINSMYFVPYPSAFNTFTLPAKMVTPEDISVITAGDAGGRNTKLINYNQPREPALNPPARCLDNACPLAGVNNKSGDPVYLHNGEFFLEATDLEIPSRGFNWQFTRKYRSGVSYDGPLGHNWEFNYNRRILTVTQDTLIEVLTNFPVATIGDVVRMDGNSRADLYVRNQDGSFKSPTGYYTTLTEFGDGRFIERDRDGMVTTYDVPDSDGTTRMTSMADRNDNIMRFEYNDFGQLEHVWDTLGRRIDYQYENRRLTKVTDFFGRSLSFGYDSNGDLVQATSPSVNGTPNGNDFPNGKTERYSYSSGFDDDRLNHNMLSVTAPNEVATLGPPRVQIEYGENIESLDFDRVIEQVLGGTNVSGIPAGGRITYRYEQLDVTPAPFDFASAISQTTVTDRNGNVAEYQFNQLGNISRNREFTNRDIRGASDPEFYETRNEYNSDGQLVRQVFAEGNAVEHDYDESDADRFQQGNLKQVTLVRDADPDDSHPDRDGDQEQIVSAVTIYEPIYNQIRSITEARGNDQRYVPQNGGANSAERYTAIYFFDYQESQELASAAPNHRRDIDGSNGQVNQSQLIDVDPNVLTNEVWLLQESMLPEDQFGLTELRRRLDASSITLGLGDLNDDGNTTPVVSGNVIQLQYPTVNLLSGSNQSVVEGDTLQEVVELFTYNRFGQLASESDPEGNVIEFEYYSEQDPDGDGNELNPSLDADTGGYLRQTRIDTVSDAQRNSATNPIPADIRTVYEYDPVGNMTRDIDGRGIATDYVYNELNQIVQVVSAAEHGLLESSNREPLPLMDFGYTEWFFYDFNDNIIRTQIEDRGNTSNVGVPGDYNDDGVVGAADYTIWRDTLDSTTDLRADADTNGVVDHVDYLFWREQHGASSGFVDYSYSFDILDNIIETRTEVSVIEELTTRYRYDANENQVLLILPEGNATSTEYDERDLMYRMTAGARHPGNQLTSGTVSSAGADTLSDSSQAWNIDEWKGRSIWISSGAGAGQVKTIVANTEDELILDSPWETPLDDSSTYEITLTLLGSGDPTNYDVRGGIPCECITRHYDKNRNIIELVDGEDTDESAANNSQRGGPGDRTRYIYDGFDRLTSVIDSVGNQSVYQYDPAGNVIRTSAFGPVGGASPKSDGPDTSTLAVSSGGVIQLENLASDNLLAATESLFDELSREFQTDAVLFIDTVAMARLPDVADGAAEIGKENISPDDDQLIAGVSTVSPFGRVTTRTEYDRNGRPTFAIEDDGDTYRAFYDGVDRVVMTLDPIGNSVETAYDHNSNVIEVRETDVAQVADVSSEIFLTTYFYDSLNRLQREVDNIGNATYYRYDSRNNRVARADSQGPLSGQSINRRVFADGTLTVNEINNFGNVTRYFFDGINRQTLQETVLSASGGGDGAHIGASLEGIKDDPNAPESFLPKSDPSQGGSDRLIRAGATYDANSLVSALIDDQGNMSLYLYDNLNRTVAETKGLTRDSVLDKTTILGQREVVTPTISDINDPATIPEVMINLQLADTKTRIDAIADLFPPLADNVDDSPPTTITYGYDPDGNLLIREDENDTEVFTLYDAINRPVSVRVFRSGQLDSHSGDAIFSPNPTADPSHPSKDFASIVGTTKRDYQYDGLSRLTTATDNNDPAKPADNSVVTYAYDSLGRLIEERQEIGDLGIKVISTAWRADNLRSALTFPDGREVKFTYDDLDRLDTITDQGASQPLVDYNYLGIGRVLERLYPISNTRLTSLDNTGITNAGYDGLRRPVEIRHLRNNNSLIVGFTHTFDRIDNKLTEGKLHDPANDEVYSYDSAYRLVSFERPNLGASVPSQSEWMLDGVGNWKQVDGEVREHSSINEVTRRTGTTETTLVYDDNGNVINDGQFSFQWDYHNRLRVVSRHTDGMVIATYTYDANNRRIGKHITNSGSQNGRTDYFYDGWQVIEERDSADAVTQQYVYGNYLDEVLTLDNRRGGITVAELNDGVGDERHFYHTNTLYHVYGMTDETGALVEAYQYEAYGEHTTISDGPDVDTVINFSADDLHVAGGVSSYHNPFVYTGQRFDRETGLSYFKNRYFDPDLGRFISRDPIHFEDGLNLYAYVNGWTTTALDPFGFGGYFFDGTGNDKENYDRSENEAPTHVAALWRSYRMNDEAFYSHGVGTRTDVWLGNTTGKGARERLDTMFAHLENQFAKGDKKIDIFGFSRGAAMAREFANMIKDKYPCAKIRFLGLFDTVSQFGSQLVIPPSSIEVRLSIPDTVVYTAHAVAKHEYRTLFPLASVVNAYGYLGKYTPKEIEEFKGKGYWEKPFAGAHSDVGGGYSDGTNLDALYWMYDTASANGVPINRKDFGDIAAMYPQASQWHDSRYWWNDRVPLTSVGRYSRTVYPGNLGGD